MPTHFKRLQIKSYQIISNHIKSYQIISNQIKSIQIKSNQIKSYQIKAIPTSIQTQRTRVHLNQNERQSNQDNYTILLILEKLSWP